MKKHVVNLAIEFDLDAIHVETTSGAPQVAVQSAKRVVRDMLLAKRITVMVDGKPVNLTMDSIRFNGCFEE